MIYEFITDPEEVGLIIVIPGDKVKYIGEKNTIVITDKLLEQNVENECLDKLILFNENNICKVVSEYREKGINARIYSVFKYKGHRTLDFDETDGYIKCNLILK